MFDVNANNVIRLTRGNSAAIEIAMTDSETGEKITMDEADKMVLTVKNLRGQKVLQKIISPDDRISEDEPIYACSFAPEETVDLPDGEYQYDVMFLRPDGTVATFISSLFMITRAVGIYTDIGGANDG